MDTAAFPAPLSNNPLTPRFERVLESLSNRAMILISPVPAAQGREPVFPVDPSLGELQPLQRYPSHLPPKHAVRTAWRFFGAAGQAARALALKKKRGWGVSKGNWGGPVMLWCGDTEHRGGKAALL